MTFVEDWKKIYNESEDSIPATLNGMLTALTAEDSPLTSIEATLEEKFDETIDLLRENKEKYSVELEESYNKLINSKSELDKIRADSGASAIDKYNAENKYNNALASYQQKFDEGVSAGYLDQDDYTSTDDSNYRSNLAFATGDKKTEGGLSETELEVNRDYYLIKGDDSLAYGALKKGQDFILRKGEALSVSNATDIVGVTEAFKRMGDGRPRK